jgi:hypothetical protein
MWVRHSSLLSRWIPKYLAVSPCGIGFPFSVTGTVFSSLGKGNVFRLIFAGLYTAAF